jgi:hypothetical protein
VSSAAIVPTVGLAIAHGGYVMIVGFAYRELWNVPPGAGSLRLDTRELDHLAPLLGFVGDKLPEVGRRAGKQCAAEIGKPSLDLGVGKSSIDFLVELVDDFGGRVVWRTDAKKRAGLLARHKIADGRQVRQRVKARRCAHRQRAQPAGPDVLDRYGRSGEHDLHLTAKQISNRRCLAPVWHVNQIDTGHHFE